MGNEEYEKAYREAREALYRRGKEVSGPQRGPDGVRYCRIDGLPLKDCDLLREAWGEKLTYEILSEWTESQAHPLTCQKCERCLSEYRDATRLYVRLFTKNQIVSNRHDSVAIAQLAPALQQAVENSQRARNSVQNHAIAHRLGRV